MYLKRRSRLLAALLIAVLIAGCSSRQDTPDASGSPIDSAGPVQDSAAHTDAPEEDASGLIEITDLPSLQFAPPMEGDASPQVNWSPAAVREGKALLYIYNDEKSVFEGYGVARPEKATLFQLCQTAGLFLGYGQDGGTPFGLNQVRQEKSMAVIDMDGDFLARYEQNGLSVPALLHSLSRTVLENHADCDSIGFTRDGGAQFSAGGITLPADGYGYFEPLPLYTKLSDGAYRSLRESVPYPGLHTDSALWEIHPFCLLPEKAAQPAEAAELLYLIGDPKKDFSDAGELDDGVKIAAALESLPVLQATPLTSSLDNYAPALEPIATIIGDSSMITKEHVEAAVKELFGSGATVTHKSVNPWNWHPVQGVYTPPHRGGSSKSVPVVLRLEETQDGYQAQAVFIRFSMSAYQDENEEWVEYVPASGSLEQGMFYDLEKDSAFLDLVNNRLPRWNLTIKKDAAGELYLASAHKQ